MTLALQGTAPIACDEHELVAAVRRGDDRAFEALFSRYERRITAYVASMVGDHARAEDITQDVFISALRRMRETSRSIAFKPWIYEIAKNACIDEFRRVRRSHEVSLDDGEGSGLAARSVSVHAPPPQAAFESKQQIDDLCGAFGGLSESHHRVLVLRELEGLSYSEIGERLGMTKAMVESTLFRARRRLSEEYEELASGRRCARVQSLIDAGGHQPVTLLGVRDRRLLARHLAHCEACRRRARIDGVDESLLEPRRRLARLAALLPIPLPLLRWRRGGSGEQAVAQSGSHTFTLAQSLQNVAPFIDPSGTAGAVSRAAAAAAAIAIASAGGGIVATLGAPAAGRPGRGPAASVSAPATTVAALSFTRILAPVTAGGAAPSPLGGARIAGVASAEGSGSPNGLAGAARPDAAGASRSTALDGAGGGRASGSGGTGGSGGSGGGGGLGVSGVAGSSPGGGILGAPSVSSPSTSSGPGAPQVPSPPSGAPNDGAPQLQDAPTDGAQTPQAPDPSSVQSTVQSVPTATTQTIDQGQQSVPAVQTLSMPASPPSAG